MSNLQALLEQKAALDHQIASLRTAERSDAISKVRALMAEHGLTAADVQGQASAKRGKGQGPATGTKVAPKFKHPETGATWTGRGLKPRWMTEALANGKALEDFAI